MSFQPVVPFGGFAGWAFLQRTQDAQRAAFQEAPRITRETDHFRDNIAAVLTVDDIMADRTLLTVALGAFGLDADINNTAFIKKVLSDGVIDPDALSNKLADKRYFEMSKAFAFDLGTPSTVLSTFPDEIIDLYNDRQFEVAVGEQSEEMRLALGLERDLTEIAQDSSNDAAKWFLVMGNEPLRSVFDTAFGLPDSFGAIDLDQQLEVYQARALSAFGDSSVSQFATSEGQEELIRRFFALGQIEIGLVATSGASAALTLLQSMPSVRDLIGQ